MDLEYSLLSMPRIQGPEHYLPKPFFMVVFAASNFERCSNILPQTKSRLVSTHREVVELQVHDATTVMQTP